MRETTYKECIITPCPGGFGEYECGEANGEAWVDEVDLVEEMTNAVLDLGGHMVELGVHPLPPWAADIRGSIRNEPVRVFAALLPGHGPAGEDAVVYYGVVEGE